MKRKRAGNREPPGSNTIIVSSRVPMLMRVRLKLIAARRGITLNRLIKQTLQELIDREGV